MIGDERERRVFEREKDSSSNYLAKNDKNKFYKVARTGSRSE